LVQAFLKKWWVESDFNASNLCPFLWFWYFIFELFGECDIFCFSFNQYTIFKAMSINCYFDTKLCTFHLSPYILWWNIKNSKRPITFSKWFDNTAPKIYSRVIEWYFLKCSFLHYIVILVETNDRCSGNYIGCCQLNYKFGNTITCNPSLEYIIFKLLLVKCIGVQMRKKKYTY
jgi:hypothetical protein